MNAGVFMNQREQRVPSFICLGAKMFNNGRRQGLCFFNLDQLTM